jgi:hypothetical protein
MIQNTQNVSNKQKQESLERLIQQYLQAKANGNTQQIKILEAILKRLGYNKFRS